MRTLTGKLENVQYFDTSRNGNSRYTATIGGVMFFTGVDSCLGSSIKNYEEKHVRVSVRIIRGKLTIDGKPEVFPENPNTAYIRKQFAVICADIDHIPMIKIFSKDGATDFINITPLQLRAIESVMCDQSLIVN